MYDKYLEVVAYAYNFSIQEAEQEYRVQGQPKQHRKTLSKNKTKQKARDVKIYLTREKPC